MGLLYFLDKRGDVLYGVGGRLIDEDRDGAEACAARLEQMHVEIAEMEKRIGSFFERGADGQRDRGKFEVQLDMLKWALWQAALSLSIHYDYELPIAAAEEAAEKAEEAAKAEETEATE